MIRHRGKDLQIYRLGTGEVAFLMQRERLLELPVDR
jgi:hypothetical protein